MRYEEYIAAVDPLRHSGNWPGVLDLAEKYFAESRSGASLVHLCEALIHTRQSDRFRTCLSDLREIAPASPDIARLEALCAMIMPRPIEASAEEPQSFAAYLSEVEPLRAQGDWERVRPLAQARFEIAGEAASLLHLCEALLHTGDRDALAAALGKLRILAPDSPDVLRLDAQYHNAIEDFDGAIALWKEVSLRFPEDAEPYASIAQILLLQEQYAPLAQLLALLPKTVASDYGLRNIDHAFLESLRRRGAPFALSLARRLSAAADAKTIDWLVSAVRRTGSGDLLLKLVLGLDEEALHAPALRGLELLREFIPHDFDHDLLRLRLLTALGRREEAMSLARSLASMPDSPLRTAERYASFVESYHGIFGQDDFLASVLCQAGAAIQKSGDLSELVRRLEGLGGGSVVREVLMSLPPPSQNAMRAEYDLWRIVHGAFAAAEDPVSSFVERFQTADPASIAQFNQIASSLFQGGRFELLARVLDAFAGTPFETPKAIRLRAILASRLERWRDAAREWAKVMAKNPDDGWASLNVINAQIHCGEFDSARHGLATLLQSGRAETTGVLPEAASCALRLGDLETAQAVLEDRSFRPEDLRQHQRMQLARVFALSGRTDDALAFYGKKQDLRPIADDNLALIVDPGLTITSGHHLNYTLFCWDLFQKLIGAGQPLTPLLLCGGGVPLSAEVKALNVRPDLVFEPYAYEEAPTVHRYLRPLNECLYRDLSRPEIAGRVSLVVVHSMRAVMVEGFSRWAADVFREQPGVAVVGLIEVDHLAESPEVIRFYEDIYREGLSRMAAHPNIHLLVYVETRMGKEFLERLGIAGMEVKLYPYLAASLSAKYCAPLDDGFLERPICLGAVGGTRQDRGSWIFPRLIANTQDLAGSCRWKLQLDRQKLSTMLSEADMPLVEALSAFPNVSIVDQTLTSAGYYELLDQIDVVILPYQDRYSVSGSGVLYEAVYMGKYLLVPSRTFMPEELARLGHPHRVFEEPTLACIEEQVRWVVQNQAQVKRELTTLRQGKPHALPAEEFCRSIARALHGI